MQLLSSLEGPVAEAAALISAIFAAGGDPGTPKVQARVRKFKQAGGEIANRILLLGSMRELALYRAEVLRHHGFRVLIPETEEEAAKVVREADFDVAVLSYTLSDTAVQRLVELVRAYCPGCPIVAIAQTTREDRRIQPDSVVVGEKGPAELITAIRRVLRHP